MTATGSLPAGRHRRVTAAGLPRAGPSKVGNPSWLLCNAGACEQAAGGAVDPSRPGAPLALPVRLPSAPTREPRSLSGSVSSPCWLVHFRVGCLRRVVRALAALPPGVARAGPVVQVSSSGPCQIRARDLVQAF